jgi:hypothetical protein
MTTEHRKLEALIEGAIAAIDDPTVPLSVSVRQSIRIAKLRSDRVALWWLRVETVSLGDHARVSSLNYELRSLLPDGQVDTIFQEYTVAHINSRAVQAKKQGSSEIEEKVLSLSVGEIEAQIDSWTIELVAIRADLARVSLDSTRYFELEKRRMMYENALLQRTTIVGRIRNRVHEFLIDSEIEVLTGQYQSDYSVRNKIFVEEELAHRSPIGLEQFRAIYQRLAEGTPESTAQALVSCRRMLKSVADVLYPAVSQPVVGSDGRKRVLSEGKYLSRLHQFVFEASSAGSDMKALLSHSMDSIGDRLDRIYDMSCKGVHAEVELDEGSFAVEKAVELVGDLFRICAATTKD